MKKNLFKLIIPFLLIFFNSYSYAKIQNKIILKVENEIITNYEIKNKILRSLILSGEEISQENINRYKNQALESLIQLKIKKIELKKYNISKNNDQVNRYLNSISSNNIPGLKKRFVSKNINFELFLDEIETESKWQKLIFKLYSKKIDINKNIINNELKKIIQNKNSFEEFKISEIEVFINNNKSDEEKISNLKQEIKKIGFEAAARKYSISSTASSQGDLGWINSNSLSEEISQVLKKISPGQITDPIYRTNSVLFLKLNDKRVSSTDNINVSDLKKKLLDQKKNELFGLYSKSHLSKLKNNSLIEYK